MTIGPCTCCTCEYIAETQVDTGAQRSHGVSAMVLEGKRTYESTSSGRTRKVTKKVAVKR